MKQIRQIPNEKTNAHQRNVPVGKHCLSVLPLKILKDQISGL